MKYYAFFLVLFCHCNTEDAVFRQSVLFYVCNMFFLPSCLFSRVVYVFGPPVKEPPTDVTPTFLTTGVLSTLRQADFEAHNILRESGRYFALSHGLRSCFKIPSNLTGYSYSGTVKIYKLLELSPKK